MPILSLQKATHFTYRRSGICDPTLNSPRQWQEFSRLLVTRQRAKGCILMFEQFPINPLATETNCSPTAESLPSRDDVERRIDYVIARMLSTGGAGMVRQNSQLRADRQVKRLAGNAIAMRDDAVLLIG